MSDDDRTPEHGDGPAPPLSLAGGPADGGEPPRPRVRKRRLLMVLAGLAVLASVSTAFGMMMAVASDLPQLENRQEYRAARNSILLDVRGRPLAVLTGKRNRILVREDQVSLAMRRAIIAIEDRRFFENSGIDIRGIGRAFLQNLVRGRTVQGGSTITQQFVKNALAAQNQRTVFQKLRESALAYHLTRKWSKGKILNQYLNSIYFGNGAYGIESAARTYFGRLHGGNCGTQARPCAALLRAPEAALIAGVVANPTAYDPVSRPAAAKARRDLVLRKMLEQGFITRAQYDRDVLEALPTPAEIEPPREPAAAPYFTTWVKQKIVDELGAGRAFDGGLRIRTTLDLDLQRAAEKAVFGRLPPGSNLPSAALVVIDNRTGGVRAMVGGADYNRQPFNLATQGQRQPGSAFKPFVLAAALESGIAPGRTYVSAKQIFDVPGTGGKEKFVVNNYENRYAGVTTLAAATTYSDNSVYAQVGQEVGIPKIARLAERMGIRTPVSRNLAIALGALKQGATPLDMAHAYEVFAAGGLRVTGSLGDCGDAAGDRAPVGVLEVLDGKRVIRRNRRCTTRVLPESVARTETGILQTVVTSGTGKAASYGGFAAGKTGTTEDYGDAWFVGFNERYSVAVWVGYADRLRAMKTEYRGGPVAGGTFPAEIWRDFMLQAKAIDERRAAAQAAKRTGDGATTTTGSVPVPAPTTTPTTTTPAPDTKPTDTTAKPDAKTPAPKKQPAPKPDAAPGAPAQQPTPTPTPAPGPAPPSTGGGASPPTG